MKEDLEILKQLLNADFKEGTTIGICSLLDRFSREFKPYIMNELSKLGEEEYYVRIGLTNTFVLTYLREAEHTYRFPDHKARIAFIDKLIEKENGKTE